MLDEAKTAEPIGVAPPPGDTGAQSTLDRILALACDLLDIPGALLVLIDGDRAVLAATAGIDVTDAPRDLASGFPLSEPGPCVVPDARLDLRTLHHPLVAGPIAARFYAGIPLLAAAGAVRGVLCLVDRLPRPMPSSRDMARLTALAALASDVLAGGRAVARAQAAAEAKADLLADVSHELRTPLTGIAGFTQLLRRDGRLDEEANRAVRRIDEAGRAMLGVIEDALDLSQIEGGVARIELRPFAVERLIEDAAALVQPGAERKGLRLVVDLPEVPLPTLLGDSDRLRQVLLNLLSNAVKFTETGTVRVGLTVDPDASAGRSVPLAIVVEDSGVGIARDGIPRLFRRFAQADGSVARRFGGTGLGLAISKTLVEAMGGSITVESGPGAGARFSVRLALPRAKATRPPTPRRRPPIARDGLKGLAILLAEDAPLNQKLVLQMLAPLGAEIDVVADGAAAVAAVKGRHYALVLMDMEMPVLDGLAATRSIRALGGPASTVPIVALTANVYPEQIELCRAAGMDHHLVKPFGADDLAAAALRWARRSPPSQGETQGQAHVNPFPSP